MTIDQDGSRQVTTIQCTIESSASRPRQDSYRAVSDRAVPFCVVPCRVVLDRAVLCFVVPFRVVLDRAVLYTVLCRGATCQTFQSCCLCTLEACAAC